MPFLGYIENPEFLALAQEIAAQFLTFEAAPGPERQVAKAIVAYVGPDVISDGRFIPPEDYYIPPEQLEMLSQKAFPNEGCRVERLWFSSKSAYIVLVVEASDQPTGDYIEHCLLLAVLTSLGEQTDATPVQTPKALRDRVREVVAGFH